MMSGSVCVRVMIAADKNRLVSGTTERNKRKRRKKLEFNFILYTFFS